MEVFNLGDDLEPITLSLDDTPAPSSGSGVSFGPGIELLMNDKKRNSSNNVNVDLEELDNMEKELNELSNTAPSSQPTGSSAPATSSTTKTLGLSGLGSFASNLFGMGGNKNASTSGSQSANEPSTSNLGQATKDTAGSTHTWDGFAKYNDIPSTNGKEYTPSKLNDREKRRKKRAMIQKLEEWYEKGLIKHNSRFTMESSFEEVEDEYETAMDEKRKKDSVKLQGWWFMTFVNSIEYANAAFNPFDLKLDGWGEQISEDIDSYEEIFSELHEKYKGGKLAPELSLLLRLGFSASVVHFTNNALSSATPGFNDVIRQSPELMKMFTNATVSSMSQKSPGFAFASNLMNQGDSVNTSFGPPPAPIETKTQAPPARPGMTYTQAPGNNRQDISAARGAMFKDQGVDITNNYADPNRQERSIRPPASNPGPSSSNQSQMRPEMRGPQNSDIDNILAGLKTRTVNIHEPPQPSAQSAPSSMQGQPAPQVYTPYQEDDSMISISSLKDLNGNMPKRSNRRKNRSDKNTISLDI